VAPQGGASQFDLFVGGSAAGRVLSPLSGEHNQRNALAALALAAEAASVPLHELVHHLSEFRGVRRRQELLGVADGVRVYEDFAHHPTAVRETLAGLAARHPEGRLVAVFEPRSATASRRIHQSEYAAAFRSADVTLLAPVGRPEIAEGERLDLDVIATEIRASGRVAETPRDVDAIVARVTDVTRPGDTVVLMSNGAFGGIYDRVLISLTARGIQR
jgi:UDP-N-acetylmuramate: L-alanyl-gamma-D-glutamyl-meso-diaminopimelate ligase